MNKARAYALGAQGIVVLASLSLWLVSGEVRQAFSGSQTGGMSLGMSRERADAQVDSAARALGVGMMTVAWVAFVLRVYLIPELPKGCRLRGVAGSVVGLVTAFLVDKGVGDWGAADLWVRFGALLGCGVFLGVGVALGERGGELANRVIRGGLSGGFVGLVCVFAAEIELMGHAAGASPLMRTMLPPAICGAVIGLTLRGAELLFAGKVTVQWWRYWPLILMALVVLINAVGPVLLVQYWYLTGSL